MLPVGVIKVLVDLSQFSCNSCLTLLGILNIVASWQGITSQVNEDIGNSEDLNVAYVDRLHFEVFILMVASAQISSIIHKIIIIYFVLPVRKLSKKKCEFLQRNT